MYLTPDEEKRLQSIDAYGDPPPAGVMPGWTRKGWVERCRYVASVCRDPGRASWWNQWAENCEQGERDADDDQAAGPVQPRGEELQRPPV